MRRRFFVWMIVIEILVLISCNNTSKTEKGDQVLAENMILQQEDGTIALKVDNAECYSDMIHPSSNTAEWNVVVSKSGRFNVWLSSATKDTTNLNYANSVMLSISDNRLEAHPKCDKVFHNSREVIFPYFRTDSFMGSLYIQDTGMYNIQVISEKILPRNDQNAQSVDVEGSKLISVFLTPIPH